MSMACPGSPSAPPDGCLIHCNPQLQGPTHGHGPLSTQKYQGLLTDVCATSPAVSGICELVGFDAVSTLNELELSTN